MKSFFLIMISLLLIVFLSDGCSGSEKLPGCNELTNNKSEYFAAGIMDHHELKKEWLLEEIESDKVADWFVKFCESNLVELKDKDSVLYNKQMKALYEDYKETWENIEKKLKDGDKIFFYSTPDNYWYSLTGQNGLVIIRGCEIVYVMVLSQS